MQADCEVCCHRLRMGDFPRAPAGQRFGNFEWHSSRSPGVVGEIVEFAYEDDARLFVTRPGGHRQISAGQLWTTKSTWHWRVWSINSAGDIGFSSARAFPHQHSHLTLSAQTATAASR